MNREQKIAVLAAAANVCPDPERKAKYLAQKHVLILASTEQERERELENAYQRWKNLENRLQQARKKGVSQETLQKIAEEKIKAYQDYTKANAALLTKRPDTNKNKSHHISELIKKGKSYEAYNKIGDWKNHTPEGRLAKHKEKNSNDSNGSHPGCNQYEHKPGCPHDKD